VRAGARDLEWTLAVNGATTLLGLLTSVILAQALGPEGRGELAAIQNIPNVLVGFGSLGIATAAAYLSGRYPQLAGQMMVTSFAALLLWSIPVLAVTYFAVPVLLGAQSSDVIRNAQIYLLIIPIQFAISAPFWVLQGTGEFKLWNILRIQAPIAWLAIIGVAWVLDSLIARTILQLHLAVMFFLACAFLGLALRKIPRPHRPEFSRLPELLRYGLPTALTALPQQLNQRLDQLLIATLMTAESLGIYVVAVAWSNVFSPILTSVSQVIFPRLAANHHARAQAETLSRTLRMTVFIALILSTALITLTPFALPMVFGPAFEEAVPLTFVLIVGTGISTINQVASEALRGLGVPKLPMICEFAGLAVTIVMLGLLLRHYELMGAAMASLASYSVTLVALVFYIARRTQLSPWSLVIPRREDLQILFSRVMKVWQRIFGGGIDV